MGKIRRTGNDCKLALSFLDRTTLIFNFVDQAIYESNLEFEPLRFTSLSQARGEGFQSLRNNPRSHSKMKMKWNKDKRDGFMCINVLSTCHMLRRHKNSPPSLMAVTRTVSSLFNFISI